jgi:hypothetical protein
MRLQTIAPLCGALLGAFACTAQAEVHLVFHPVVEFGEWEAEARGFVTRDTDPSLRADQVTEAEIAYGVTPYWWTELEMIFDKPPGETAALAAIASENVFQLTEQGEYFADFGLFAEYERSIGERIHEITLAPIVEKDFGLLQATANVFFTRKFGPDSTESEVEISEAAQLRYRWLPAFEPGIEYQSDPESRSVGPGIFGKIPLGNGRLKYQLVALFGLKNDSPDQTFRWTLEYEFGRSQARSPT